MADRSVQRRKLGVVVAALALAGAMLPRRGLERLPTVCPVRLLTGYPCPTCGMTRSWQSLLHLEPLRAFRDHPFGPLVMAALALGIVSPGRAELVSDRVAVLPSRIKVLGVGSWLGWWAVRLVDTRRSRRGHG